MENLINKSKSYSFRELKCENCGNLETVVLDQNYNILAETIDCSHCGLIIYESHNKKD